mmetsp:Transcript_24372/g.29758  ORF Transcript_24372/g.29758 Transcript_24372/m.29758 type:complete len:80 (+) Transcript_24372:1-240(+)
MMMQGSQMSMYGPPKQMNYNQQMSPNHQQQQMQYNRPPQQMIMGASNINMNPNNNNNNNNRFQPVGDTADLPSSDDSSE